MGPIAYDEVRRLRHGTGSICPAGKRLVAVQCHLSQSRAVSAPHSTGRWNVVRALECNIFSDIFRYWVPAWARPVHFVRSDIMGCDRAGVYVVKHMPEGKYEQNLLDLCTRRDIRSGVTGVSPGVHGLQL